MSEAVAEQPVGLAPGSGFLSVRIGWRNLWRNRRRTWLTSGGIAFAVLLVVFTMAMQFGQYEIMEENATSLITGQIQIQSLPYVDSGRFEDTLDNASELASVIAATPGVAAVAPRVEAFALASADERSFGAQVLGIDIAAEANTTRFTKMLESGRMIAGPGDAVLGKILARNLGVGVGAEVVVLGSGKEGGVAAMVVVVSGILETGMTDLDRSFLLASLPVVQDAFGLTDEVHTFAIRTDDLDQSKQVAAALQKKMPDLAAVRHWELVMPEVLQGIEVDRIGGMFMYWLIMILVVFSVINSFIMTVFERTREFGMLRAIGMRPAKIILMVQFEALFGCLIGVAIGLALASAVIAWLIEVGIPLGEAMEDYATQFYMPARLYPAFSAEALLTAPVVMVIGTQIAAILPALRIRQLKPVEALRED